MSAIDDDDDDDNDVNDVNDVNGVNDNDSMILAGQACLYIHIHIHIYIHTHLAETQIRSIKSNTFIL